MKRVLRRGRSPRGPPGPPGPPGAAPAGPPAAGAGGAAPGKGSGCVVTVAYLSSSSPHGAIVLCQTLPRPRPGTAPGAAHRALLERQIVGVVDLAVHHRVAAAVASGSGRARAIEELHVLRHDFRRVALLAVLPVPRPRLQAALDVDAPALLQELVALLGQLVPGHHPHPLGLFAAFAVGRAVLAADRDGEVRDRAAVGREPHLRVAAEVADDHHLVQARHRRNSSRSLSVARCCTHRPDIPRAARPAAARAAVLQAAGPVIVQPHLLYFHRAARGYFSSVRTIR